MKVEESCKIPPITAACPLRTVTFAVVLRVETIGIVMIVPGWAGLWPVTVEKVGFRFMSINPPSRIRATMSIVRPVVKV